MELEKGARVTVLEPEGDAVWVVHVAARDLFVFPIHANIIRRHVGKFDTKVFHAADRRRDSMKLLDSVITAILLLLSEIVRLTLSLSIAQTLYYC